MPDRDERTPRGGFTFSRRRIILAAVAGLVLFGLLTARAVAGVATDYLWFDHLGFDGVWWGLLGARVGVALVFIAFFFALMWASLFVADRVSPPFVPLAPHEEAMAQVHRVIERRRGLARIGLALVFALMVGAGAAGQWNEWILFRNRVDFGISDPEFGRDVGFYVFQLPFITFAIDWLVAALIVIAVVTAGLYYFNGGIRWNLGAGIAARRPGGPRPGPFGWPMGGRGPGGRGPGGRGPDEPDDPDEELDVPIVPPERGLTVTRAVKIHLSVLFGAIALVRTADYFFGRFELMFSSRGVVDGASYTDVHAQIPALNLLMAISVLAAILFLANIRRQGWILPALAVGLWALVSVIVGTAYPAFIQRFRVEPAESTREALYIERNIEATRAAMGLDDVEVREFAYDEQLDAEALGRNADIIRNVRLWDPGVLRQTYQRLQEVRTFYRFTDVDVDRYTVAGDLTQIMLSARELSSGSLPADTWENRHLAFTHGYGAVLSPANAVTTDGQPDFLVKNIPPQGDPAIEEPRLYHGEAISGYAIVNAGRDEIDYLAEDGTAVTNRYDGSGGVGIGSLPRRLAFALRFGDINPLISGFMTSESRILYIRDVRERARTLAPFLHFDYDPYPVVLDGRMVWVLDAYTTSDHYPYGQTAENDRLEPNSGLRHDFNYVRNSVKVAIDAYNGDATFYVVDPDDPVIAAYAKAFPELFTPGDEAPDELAAHFRYPEDLFRVQTNMWGRYHIGDPDEFYSQSDRWNIAQDPGGAGAPVVVTPTDSDTDAPATSTRPARARMEPYYLLMRLPDAPGAEFLILQPFVPFSEDDTRRELSSFMVAKSDPDDYGRLEVFVMPRDLQVDGPAIVNARINQEPEVSQLITLLSRAGSEVLLGNLVVIPMEQSLLYVRPLYVQATGANAVPELKKVVVVFGDRVAISDTLQGALIAVFGAAPDTLEEGAIAIDDVVVPTDAVVSDEVRRLLEQANQSFADAEEALRNGDLAGYERNIRAAREAIDAARGEDTPAEPEEPEGVGEGEAGTG